MTTKQNGAGRNWLEVGAFETDEFGRKQWIKRSVPHQDRRLKVDRRYSARGETVDWIILAPDDYPLTIAKIKYDRLSPMESEVLWAPGGAASEPDREGKIKRALELAADNEELMNLLKDLLLSS